MNRSQIAALVVVAALVAVVGASGVQTSRALAQTPPQILTTQPSGISVSGEGVVTAQPNVAHLTLGVEVFNPSLSAAQADASSRMDAVIKKLHADGIADGDIRTVGFSINPQYDNRDNQNPTLRGYQIQNLVDVKSANVAGLGALVDDVVGAGATRVYGIRFEADNAQQLKDQARDLALQNARIKAEQLARGTGVSLGAPILVEDNESGGVTPVRAAPAAAPAAAAAPATPIQPGELQIRSTIHVVWSIR